MARAVHALVIVLALGASGVSCRKRAPDAGAVPAASSSSSSSSPAYDSVTKNDGGFVEIGADTLLTFSIRQVHTGRRPTTAPPWHEAGGAWQFFDAVTADGAPFTFGFEPPKTPEQPPKTIAESIRNGKGMLVVNDRTQGELFIASFGKAFGVEVPPPRDDPQPLAIVPFSVVFLGFEMSHLGTMLSSGGGDWTATKLFLPGGGDVYLNFDLTGKQGAFAQTEPALGPSIVGYFAAALRDGPRKKRDLAADPTITARGPHIEWLRTIEGRPYGLSPERDAYWTVEPTDDGGTRIVSQRFATAEGATEILRVPHRVGTIACTTGWCLAEDIRPASPNAWSTNDPCGLVLVDRIAKSSRALVGPFGDCPSITRTSIAPDGSHAVVLAWRPRKSGKGRYEVVLVVGRDGSVRGPVDLGELPLRLVTFAANRAIFRRGYAEPSGLLTDDDDAKVTFQAVDLGSLVVTKTVAPKLPTAGTSPDGKRVVECRGKDQIVIRDLASSKERAYSIHPDDRDDLAEGGCPSWASNRYLLYWSNNVAGFLDADTLMLTPSWPDERRGQCEVDKDFTFIVEYGPGGTRIGRITLAP